MSWSIIIPVKRLQQAKTRLRGTAPDHEGLVLAMALDTVTAALTSPVAGRVVVVTADPEVSEAVRGLGAEVIADVPDAGLNPALAYAAAQVRPRGAAPSLDGVAALPADLPALRAEELGEALRRATAELGRSFVADAAGTGTVLLAAPAGFSLEPCFGPASHDAHTASGAVPLVGEWASLRRDVDTAADLADAAALGLGPHTAALALHLQTT